jgi:predicted Zn-dependent protease
MRIAIALAIAAFAAAVLAACGGSSDQACFENGATAYAVHAPGDTSVVFNWPTAYRPVRVYAEATGELPVNVTNGLQLWANAMHCNEISFRVVTDSASADIIVRNPTFLPPLPASGAFLADSVGACKGRTDVLVDTNTNTLLRPIRSYVVPNGIDPVALASCYHFVTAHELGHAIGLFSHSLDPADLMNSSPRRTELSANDRYTVQLLYHLDPYTRPSAR